MWMKESKYHSRKTEVDGITFDSKKEAERYCDLRMMQKAGMIRDLVRQKYFEIIPKTDKYRACYYVADFVYTTYDGKEVIEDVKGYKSGQAYQLFTIKKKLVYERYGIEITEI